MRIYEFDGMIICVPQMPQFHRDDPDTGKPIYSATGYIEGEPSAPHTWRLFWYGDALASRSDPLPSDNPFNGVKI